MNTVTKLSQYDIQAADFLKKTGATMDIKFLKHDKHFHDDKESRDIYSVTISRGSRKYTFNFGNSLKDSGFKIVNKNGRVLRACAVSDREKFKRPSGQWDVGKLRNYISYSEFTLSQTEAIETPKPPSEYSVLACLTKYDPGTLENFCSEFGYDIDSKKADRVYNAVVAEYTALCTLFSDAEMELMAEIQ